MQDAMHSPEMDETVRELLGEAAAGAKEEGYAGPNARQLAIAGRAIRECRGDENPPFVSAANLGETLNVGWMGRRAAGGHATLVIDRNGGGKVVVLRTNEAGPETKEAADAGTLIRPELAPAVRELAERDREPAGKKPGTAGLTDPATRKTEPIGGDGMFGTRARHLVDGRPYLLVRKGAVVDVYAGNNEEGAAKLGTLCFDLAGAKASVHATRPDGTGAFENANAETALDEAIRWLERGPGTEDARGVHRTAELIDGLAKRWEPRHPGGGTTLA